jgi:cell division transport system permease protein
MRAWFQHHLLSLRQTVFRLSRQPLATLFNMTVMGIALALPLGGYVLLTNVETLSRNMAAEPQISVFLTADAGKPEQAALEKRLRAATGVKSVRFVPRDEALSDLKRTPGMNDVLATLRENPLPDAFIVALATTDSAVAEKLEQDIRPLPKVAHVQLDSGWVKRLDGLLRLARTAVVVLAALLGAALIVVTFNTIRLQIMTQREEIEVSRLVGATDAFIQRPFFYMGAVMGGLAGLMALLIVGAAAAWLAPDLDRLALSYGSDFDLHYLNGQETLAVLGFAAAVGWSGAALSVSNYLRRLQSQL